MSLIYAEGFEHFHPSAMDLSEFTTPFFAAVTQVSSATTPFLYGVSSNPSGLLAPSSGGRRGGRALGATVSSGSWQTRGGLSVSFPFRKSRTVFVGFAAKATSHLSQVIVSFQRVYGRPPTSNSANWLGRRCAVLGGCVWDVRDGYADLSWHFDGQSIKYAQLMHNRNIRNNDWHYFQFGTTVYGNSVENPLAWGEARVATVSSRTDGINTAVSNTPNDSFINCVTVSLVNAAGGSGASYWIDDVYICNDEGVVNNNFLGGIFVRSTTPQYQGALIDTVASHANFRHEAVGPSYVGNPATLPSPLPSPEDDPHFVAWDSHSPSRLTVPFEMGRQNFAVHDINFQGASPRIFGATVDVAANLLSPGQARAVLAPIKTIGSTSHTIFAPTTDMVRHDIGISRMILENPRAHEAVDVSDVDWSADAVNASHYGFEVQPAIEQAEFNAGWNPDLLRYPVTHEQSVVDNFGLSEFVSRHWEEFSTTSFNVSDSSRWDWACRAFDIMAFFDEAQTPTKTLHLNGWTNVRWEASIMTPEEYIRDFLGAVDSNRFDSVARVEESLGCIVFAYHEWVEELRVWLDPYDHVERAWGVNAIDQVSFEVSDIFDGHFDVDEELGATAQIRSNHEWLEETLYCNSWTQHGVLLQAEDSFVIEADHHNANWVEQFQDSLAANSSILTRHWRFEFFWFVCIKWWEIGIVEQPLDHIFERWPCDVKNDGIIDAYKAFFGIGGYYDEIVNDLQTQWLHLGGDPNLDFFNIRWASFNTFVFDEMGNVVDMLDADGHSIIERM